MSINLSHIGFGKFHYALAVICGWTVSSDAVEEVCVSFLLPSAECELEMSTFDKGLLNVSVMFGKACLE